MRVYLRKLFPHDITHEVSITKPIVDDFFESNYDHNVFFKQGDPCKNEYIITFNNAKDHRFGGDFKSMYKDDCLDVDDILIIKKQDDSTYLFSFSKKGDNTYAKYSMYFFGNKRHVLIDE